MPAEECSTHDALASVSRPWAVTLRDYVNIAVSIHIFTQ